MKYLVVVVAALLCGCLSLKKASCHINDGGYSIQGCKNLWDLDYALMHQKP